MVQKIKRPAKDTEEAGIEPAIANYATYGFEDRGSHQTPSASAATMTDIADFVKLAHFE